MADRLSQVTGEIRITVSEDSQERYKSHDETLYLADTGNVADVVKNYDLQAGAVDVPVIIDPCRLVHFLKIKTTSDITFRFSLTDTPIPFKAMPDSSVTSSNTPGTPAVNMGLLVFEGCEFTTMYLSNPGATVASVTVVMAGARDAIAPTIAVSASTLWFIGPNAGPDPAAQTVQVQNVGDGTFAWAISTPPAAWCTVTPLTGAINGNITVSVVTTGAGAGTHTSTTFVLSAAGATASPLTVTVHRVVT